MQKLPVYGYLASIITCMLYLPVLLWGLLKVTLNSVWGTRLDMVWRNMTSLWLMVGLWILHHLQDIWDLDFSKPCYSSCMSKLYICVDFALQLRVAIHTVLCMCEQGVCLLGPDCAPWGMPARHTTQKSFINAHGGLHLPFVSGGMQMISLLLGCVVGLCHGVMELCTIVERKMFVYP